MVNIEHVSGFRGCNSCGGWTNREIYFRMKNSDASLCVSLCDECLKLLNEKMVWERIDIYKKENEEEK